MPNFSFDSLLKSMRDSSFSEAEKGAKFEKLICAALPRMPGYGDRFVRVVRWHEWPLRQNRDIGVDLVAEIAPVYGGGYCAIQCKFYQEKTYLDKPDIADFIAESGREFRDEDNKPSRFRERLVVATTDRWTTHAEQTILGQDPPVIRMGLQTLREADLDWRNVAKPKAVRGKPKEMRKHQKEAKAKVVSAFKSGVERGKLIMACGSGKTFAALKIAEEHVGKGGSVLFLVPSISLLSQSLNDFVADRKLPHRYLVVCSDSRAGNQSAEDISVADLMFPPTTRQREIARYLQPSSKALTVVFSTYQSLDVVAKAQGDSQFDLIICDEAHRTTGASKNVISRLGESERREAHFTKVHDNKHIKGRRRLYMTATPKIYTAGVKQAAEEHDAAVYSMDDKQHYGEELFRYSFSRAVKDGILADYHVHILCMKREEIAAVHEKMAVRDGVKLDDAVKMVGCWKAIRRPPPEESNKPPMKRVVAFTNKIKESEMIQAAIGACAREAAVALNVKKEKDLILDARHVDGTMNAMTRARHLAWLREEPKDGYCRILTNARCLTEGVDVPALDGVIFFAPRKSQIDIVQAVGRVMRIAPGKKVGNIILPVVLPADATPENLLSKDETYKHVWQVLSALRAHDDRFQAEVNKVQFNKELPARITTTLGAGDDDDDKSGKGKDGRPKGEQLIFGFRLYEWTNAIIPRFVENCGERLYWARWARDVSRIAESVIELIRQYINSDKPFRGSFAKFLHGFRLNINTLITAEQAIQALAQHIITKPVFDALFKGYSFSEKNAISRSMNAVTRELQNRGIDSELKTLEDFYKDVASRANDINTLEGRQNIMETLYSEFFQGAFKKDAEQAGIVYTPVEVVDFINRSADRLLRKEFGVGLTDKSVHILDPFTGTGRFVVRLLSPESNLIADKDLERKYRSEIHANEKLLLPYYIANVNIEQTYHARTGGDYEPFPNGVLCDTFNTAEKGGKGALALMKENKERANAQSRLSIKVILSNPPYSAVGNPHPGFYPTLDSNLQDSFIKESAAQSRMTLFDSYIRAMRWALDRIPSDEGGIVGFVTNSGFLRAYSADAMRKSLMNELSALYALDLRGDAYSSGEKRRQEGGGIFGGGSRTPVVIVLMIKKPSKAKSAGLHYCNIGNYLTREQKLSVLVEKESIANIAWQKITPSPEGDWLNKRDPNFKHLFPVADKATCDAIRRANVSRNADELALANTASEGGKSLFAAYTLGVVTGRDAWVYDFSEKKLAEKVKSTIACYNRERNRYLLAVKKSGKRVIKNLKAFLTDDKTKISWSDSLRRAVAQGQALAFDKGKIRLAQRRPFCVEHLYYDKFLNDRQRRCDLFFKEEEQNLTICVSSTGADEYEWSSFAVSRLPDYALASGGAQCFPFHVYVRGEKRENITDGALEKFRVYYKNKRIGKMDIFHYVYAVLHHPGYRERFKGNLMRELPRIPFAPDFRAFAAVGKKLMNLHINYENAKEFKLRPVSDPDSPQSELGFSRQAGWQDLRVERMRFGRIGHTTDKSVLRYNASLSFQIPDSAHAYKVNGKSPVEWVVDRYKISEDKDSGIVQNANDWSDERGNSAYILSLLKKAVHIGTESAAQIRTLPKDLGIPK